MGLASQILHKLIVREKDAKKILLSQKKYIQKVLRTFNMDKNKDVSTQLAMHLKLSTKHCSSSDSEKEDI